MQENTILEMKNVTKRFPGVIALNNVSIQVRQGEVMAVCGENGAGKSTLMRILSGSYPSSEYDGEIYVDGKKENLQSIRMAQNLGIEMVYQELNMVLTSSVAENLYAGNLPQKGVFVDWDRLYRETQSVLDRIELRVDPKTPAGNLNSGQLQMISIMRAAIKNPRIIVLDEPTSSLTDREVNIFFRLVRELKEKGVSILFISHKLEEVFEIADRVTVIRDGEVISVHDISEVNNEILVENMVGRKISNQYPKVKAQIGEELLRVEHLTVPSPSVKGTNIVEDVSFCVHSGEVLGIGGLVGAGRSESLAAVFGQISQGVHKEVYIKGNAVKIGTPRQAIRQGLGFVTEERRLTGFIPSFSICRNLTLCIMDKICKAGFVDQKKEREQAESIFDRLRIKAPSMDTLVVNLSGGNQQKVVLGKWLLANPRILFIDEPTKGIDVGAKTEIYNFICELAGQGVGIVMVSSDMPELVAMSDRCIVLSEGRVTGEFVGDEISQVNILKAALA